MSVKSALLLCSLALIQSISAQCIGAIDAYGYGAPWGAAPLAAAPCTGAWGAAPYAEWAYAPASSLAASNGPGLAISSASPRVPAGVSVISENAYEGALAVGGAVPFLGTVALEGPLPTAGAGAISYGCGNGAVAVTAEDIGAYGYAGIAGPLGYGAGIAGPIGYGPAIAGYGPAIAGYGPAIAGYGPCGCGAIY